MFDVGGFWDSSIGVDYIHLESYLIADNSGFAIAN